TARTSTRAPSPGSRTTWASRPEGVGRGPWAVGRGRAAAHDGYTRFMHQSAPTRATLLRRPTAHGPRPTSHATFVPFCLTKSRRFATIGVSHGAEPAGEAPSYVAPWM